jgi:phytoene dehydrogenase-like protein
LKLNAYVDQVLVEDKRAVGVRLRGGKQILALQAVVSNASVWDKLKLLPDETVPESGWTARQASSPRY